MTTFFTLVFTVLKIFTLQEKSTYASQKNPIVAQYWGNKINILTSHQSKTKNKSCFLPVCFDLWFTSFLDICVCKEALAQHIEQHARYKMPILPRKGKGCIKLASSWMCLQRLILLIMYWRKCAFWMIRPIWNVLFRWGH